MKRLFVVFSGIFIAVSLFFSVTSSVAAANRYWVGTTDGANTSDTANWSDTEGSCGAAGGASVPGVADIAIFTSSCANGATIDTNLDVLGIDLNVGYAGTVTQGTGVTITTGTSFFIQAGGTFSGSNAAITANRAFTLSGGTFTSTSGTLTIGTNLTISGGTFNHNNGTVTFTGSDGASTLACNSVTFNAVNISKSGHSFTVGSDCTLPISGTNPTIAFGTGGDTLNIYGTLNITGNPSFTGRTVTLHSGGTIAVSGTSMTFARNLILNGGTFPQGITTLTVGGDLDNTSSLLPDNLDLTINANNATTLTCGTVTFNSVTISKTGNALTVGSTCVLPIAGTNPTLTTGSGGSNGINNNGTINVTGNLTFNGGNFNQNSGGTLTVSGTTATFSEHLALTGGSFPQNLTTLTVGGSLNNSGNLLPDNLDLTLNTNVNSTLTCGTVTFNSVTISKTGNGVAVGSSCVLPIAGTNPTITVGSNATDTVANNGIIQVTGDLTFIGGTFTQNVGGTLSMTGTTASFSRNLTLTGGTFPQGITSLTVGGTLNNTGNLLPNGVDLILNGNNTGNLNCGTDVFNSITFSKGANIAPISSCSMGDLTNSGTSTISNPVTPYTYTVTGDVTFTSNAYFGGSNLTLLLAGSDTQTLSNPNIAFLVPFQFNNPTGTIQTTSDIFAGYSCSLLSGTLDAGSRSILCATGFSVANGATLQISGGGFIYDPTLSSGSTVRIVGDGDSSGDTFSLPNFSYSNLTLSMTDSSDVISVANTLTTNLLGYWKMDEGSGSTVEDVSVNNNTGNITNATFSSTVPPTDFSDPYSLSFDGSGDYVNIGDNLNVAQNKSEVSLSAWVRLNNVSGTKDIIGLSTGTSTANDRVNMQIVNDELRCQGRAGDNETLQVVTTVVANLTAGTWYYFTCNFDFVNDSIVPYLDGVELLTTGTVSFPSTATSDTPSLTSAIGIDQDKAGNDFSGFIDEVRIYDRLMTKAEMGFSTAGFDTTAISELTLGGNYAQTAGTFSAPATLNAAGNWSNTGGTFTHNNGSVILNGTDQTLAGNTTFYNLTKAVNAARTLTFTTGTTQTIAGTTTLTGTSGNLLSLRSTVEDSQWSFNPQGSRSISYVDVQDSNNTNATMIATTGNNITDSGNNTNWGFDSSAPAISLTPISPDPGTDTTPSISGTANEAVGTVTDVEFQMNSIAGAWSNCTADDGTFDEATEPFTCQVVDALSDGVHTINIRATDSNGFTTIDGAVSTDTFRVDTTAPTTPGTPSTTTPTADTTPTWSWTASTDTGGSGLATPAYTVEWSQDSGFSGGVSSSTSTTNSFTHSSTLSSGTWYFRVLATDVASNASSYSSNGTVVVDTVDPGAPGTPSATSPTGSTSQDWSWTAGSDALSGIAHYAWRVTTSLGAAVTNGTTAVLTVTTNLTEGIYNFFIKTVDNAGNESSEVSSSVTVDTTGPTTPGTPSTSSATDDPTPTWTWTESSDSGVGLASSDTYTIEWSQSSSFGSGVSSDAVDDSTCSAGSCQFTHTTNLTNGTWYVRVKASDTVDNDSSYSASGSITLTLTPDDTAAPTGTISIQAGEDNSESYTRSATVSVAISATDDTDTADNLEMMISTASDFVGSSWESYNTSKEVTFSSSDGTKAVYIKFKDTVGNTSAIYSDSIVLDATAPDKPSLESPDDGSFTNNATPTFKFKKSSDDTSGLSKYTIKIDGETYIGDINPRKPDNSDSREDDIKKITYDGDYISVFKKTDLNDGAYSWKVVAVDAADNSRESSANEVTIDTKPPVIQLHEVSSNTTVVNPSSPDNQLLVVSTRRPTFTGVADANSTVKLTFYSDPVTCTTTAADDSTWSCTSASDIPPGNHTFEVTATDQAGNVTALPAINLVVWSGVLETEIVDTKVITKTETSATKDSSQSSQDKDDSESDTSTDTSATSENTYDVIVKIVDDKGNPLPFTKVTLFSKPREAITDKDGIAHFKDVEAGEHTIVVANNNQVGQQKITIGGKDVERYEYTIEIKETNPFLNPWVAMTIGMLVSIIIVAVTLFIREKYKK